MGWGLPRRSNTKVCQWYAVTSRHPRNTRACSFKTQAVLDSWNDLTTADTPEFLNSKAGETLYFVDERPPTKRFGPQLFSTHIAHAVGYMADPIPQ
jgi:hypothetical protein